MVMSSTEMVCTAEGRKALLVHHPVGDTAGEIVRREGGAQEAGQRDADLDGGEELGGGLADPQQQGRLLISFLRLVAKQVLIQRDDRYLRSGKESIEQDQDDLQQDLRPYRVG